MGARERLKRLLMKSLMYACFSLLCTCISASLVILALFKASELRSFTLKEILASVIMIISFFLYRYFLRKHQKEMAIYDSKYGK
jgi:hypothetical protein